VHPAAIDVARRQAEAVQTVCGFSMQRVTGKKL
jgi:hypothetical protein